MCLPKFQETGRSGTENSPAIIFLGKTSIPEPFLPASGILSLCLCVSVSLCLWIFQKRGGMVPPHPSRCRPRAKAREAERSALAAVPPALVAFLIETIYS
jgi:hypothetical protein